MKPIYKLIAGIAAALLLAVAAHAQVTATGLSASPATALPGDQVTFAVTVSNAAAVDYTRSATFDIVLTHLVTGATITLPTTTSFPVGGFVAAATVNPTTGQNTPGAGSYNVVAIIPTQFSEAGAYRATVTMNAAGVSTVTITDGGTGYGAAPAVSFAGGGGAGAAATASITAGVVTTVTVTNPGTGYTSAPSVVFAGGAATAIATVGSRFDVNTTVLTVTGSPDLEIRSLTYAASTSYVGGTVIPMTLTYRNNISTNGINNVPYVPGIGGAPVSVRVKVVLSTNPTYGDADDFQLTIQDIFAGNITSTDNNGNTALNADNTIQTFSWDQLLPGNFAGSYYVLARMDALDALTENDPPALTVNGNNLWGVPALQPEGTRINLLPSNFPAASLASHKDATTTSAGGYSDNPSLSADGRYVVFASDATDLVSADSNGQRDIFIYDSQTTLLRRLSVSQQGGQGNGASNNPKISAGGRYVAFGSEANNLIVGDTNGFSDIYVVDTITGLISRVSLATGGAQANNPSFRPAISTTGRFIAFESTATNLDPTYNVPAGSSHIYVVDRDVSGSGVFDTLGNMSTRLVDVDFASVGVAATVGNRGTPGNAPAIQAAISADGALIGFASKATNLIGPPGSTSAGRQHVYVRPRANVGGITSGMKLVSVANTTAAEGNGDSQTPSLTDNGNWIAFASLATNLVAGDTNGVSDIFVYDNTALVTAPIVRRISVSSAGVEATDLSGGSFQLGSINPTISADGRFVAFASLAGNLVPGDTNGQYHDGAYATATAAAPAAGALTTIAVDTGGSGYVNPPLVRISGGGGTGGYATAVLTGDVVTSIVVVNPGTGYTSTPTVTIVADSGDSNSALDIFVRDRDVTGAVAAGVVAAAYDTLGNTATQLVSVNTFGYQTSRLLGVPSTAASNIYPVLSGNGRFVAFPSDAENNAGLAFGATNQLPLDSNGQRDVFLFDRRTDAAITPDSPPTVTITSPGNGGTALVNTPISVTASATAATVGGTPLGVVASVQFFVNGTSLGTSTVFPYSQTWTPTAVGTYTLSAIVTDSFGNIGASPNVTVTINAAPSVGVTGPVAGAILPVNVAQTVTATAAASNPGATVASVEFFVDGVSLGTDLVAPYDVSWTPTAAGTYALTAKATDSIGTPFTSPGVSVTVLAPSVTVTNPTAGPAIAVGVTQAINASAASPGATITSVEFFVNGVSQGTDNTAPFAGAWTPAAAGTYSLTATATDSNALTFTSPAVLITVTLSGGGGGGGTPPTITPTGITALPTSALPGDNVTFTIPVSNSGTVVNNATADITIRLTNTITGAFFDLTSLNAPATAQITAATAGTAGAAGTPGTGSFNVTAAIPTQTTQAGPYRATVTLTNVRDGGGVPNPGPFTFSSSTTTLTVTGSPDLAITSLTYAAGTSYVGGTVIPMSLTYVNNTATNGVNNVPYVPGQNGNGAGFIRIQVVLSSNPAFDSGSGDDFQLTIHDVAAVRNADGVANTISWNQLLPGNFAGSYYVLAKIDSLDGQTENDPPVLSVNGNNVWGGNTLNPSATLINLVPSNFPATYLASHATGVSTSADRYSDNPSLSADGRYVAFASDATNLVVGDGNAARDIFLFDSQTAEVRRMSVSQQGVAGNAASNNPAISGNSRYVAFGSEATNLVIGDTNGFSDIYVKDVITGLISRVSLTTAGLQANNPSFRPAISETGRFLVFESTATNLDAAYAVTAGSSHIYVHDRDVSGSGVFDTAGNTSTRLVDADAGAPLTVFANGSSTQAAISADGTVIAFASRATNLVAPATTAGRRHVYTRPLANIGTATGGTRLISVANTTALEGNDESQTPSLSSNGRYVAFASVATNLVAADLNQVSDIFVYDQNAPIGTPIVRRMSVSASGGESYDPSPAGFQLGSINPTISSDGRYVAFASLAANLTPGDSIGKYQGNGATATATVAGGVITGYVVGAPGTQYSQSNPPIVIITDPTGTGASATAVVSAAGAITGITVDVGGGGAGYSAAPIVTIASDANDALDIFVRDRDSLASGTFDTGAATTQMVSVNGFGYQTAGLLGVPSTAASNIYPVLSSNGRFVAFPSDSENNAGLAFGETNQLPLDRNSVRDVFLHDRRTNAGITPGSNPTVTITSPGNGGTALVNTAIPVAASATAALVGGVPVGVVASVQFFVNGTSLGTSTVFPYTQTWTPTAVGNYTLSAIVTDSFGNIGASPNVNVTIIAAPSVGITSPSTGTSIIVNTLTTVTAVAAASNPGTTITGVEFFANGASLGAADTVAPYSAAWTPTLPGVVSLTAIATDSLGTQITSPAVSVTITPVGGGGGGGGFIGNPPTVSVTSPAPSVQVPVNTPIAITATAADSDGNIASVSFFANGTSVGTSTIYPYIVQWTPTSLGGYALTAQATDNDGNIVTSTGVQVSVVDTASALPTVTVTAPTHLSTVSLGSAHTLQATATDPVAVTGVQFFVNGLPEGGLITSFPFTTPWTPAIPGVYTITARATNVGGNQATSAAVSVTVSSGVAPTVAVTRPTNGSTVSVNSAQTITASASSAAGTIASVQFIVNGVTLSTDTNFPYSAAWTPTALGTHVLRARATDSAGNITNSAPVSVTVAEVTPGTVAVTSPAANSSVSVNVPQTIVATAAAPAGTVASVEFLVDGVALSTDLTFPYSATWTPTSLGAHLLVARSTDNLGNTTDSDAVTVNAIAAAPPVVTISSPAGNSSISINSPQNVTVNATSPAGSIAGVQLLVDGQVIGSDTTYPYSIPWLPVALGTYSLTARATDNVGNMTDSAAILVTVTSAPPATVNITGPANNGTARANVPQNITATATIASGSITRVEFLVDGVVILTDSVFPYSAAWTPTAPGTYALMARATDNRGNSTDSSVLNFAVGSSAPATVAITAPTAASAITVNSVQTITATATVGTGSIASVEFFVNSLSLGTDLAFPYAISWNPLALGTYTLIARSTDNSGNVTDSAPVNVTVSTGIPVVVTLTSPTATTLPVNVSHVLTASATSPSAPIAGVEFFVNGASVGNDLVFPYSASWTPTALGTYILIARATDTLGNSTDSTPKSVAVTTGTPVAVTLTSPTATTLLVNAQQSLTATASSPNGTIASVEFFVNGLSVGTDLAFPYAAAWTPNSLGTYVLIARATDSVGNVTDSDAKTVTVTAGNGPAVTVTTPASGSVYAVGTPLNIAATATDSDGTVAQVQFLVNNLPQGAADLSAPYSTVWTPVASGTYSVTAQATDNSGNVTTSATVIVTINLNGAPSIAITSPAVGTTTTVGTIVNLAANASDADGTIASVRFFVNGGVVGVTPNVAPYLTPWTPTAPGAYSVLAEATDNSGNISLSTVRSITVLANQAPSVALTSPANGASLSANLAVQIGALAADSDGDVVSVRFLVNGNVVGLPDSSTPFSTIWTPTAVGNYTVVAEATDNSGNITNSTARTVSVVPNQSPTVVILSPGTGLLTTAGLPIALSASAGDADGSIVGVRFLANGIVVSPDLATAPYNTIWTPASGGVYSLVAEATDNVGNISTSTAVTVNVAVNSLPVVTLSTPANGSTVRVNVATLVKATATDGDGTVASVQFFANGVALGAPVTVFPYQVSWIPTAEGLYRLSAVAIDNAGAIRNSGTALVIASSAPGDTVATGTYQGLAAGSIGIENGNFALISAIGRTGAFIGFSTTDGVTEAYFFSNIPVSVSGGYRVADATDRTLLAGSANDTGTNGTIDENRLTYIGTNTSFFGTLPPGYYSGSLSGRSGSRIAAIFGADGSIILYASEGTFEDAGGGGFSGSVDATGAFSIPTIRGNRFTGRVDPATRLLTGTLTGTNGGTFNLGPTSLALTSGVKVAGTASEVGADIVHPVTQYTYDQVLLQGPSATITADPGQIVRMSYVDTSNDIVQVEMSGAGSLSITLDNYSPPAPAVNYDQPQVSYVKGHAGIVLTGADETTHLSIFSVGRANAVNQSLFRTGVAYDGVADLAYVVILSTDGKFGGLRAGNSSFFATRGLTGILAPGVEFTGPVYVGDISAADTASPMLVLGSAAETLITGGDLWQANNQPVQVGGFGQLRFTAGMTSHAVMLPAQVNRARLQQNGADLAAGVVVNPSP